MVVLGDTAFDAEAIHTACEERKFSWIVPINPERVLAGEKPRFKVSSLSEDLTADQMVCLKVHPGKGKYVDYRLSVRGKFVQFTANFPLENPGFQREGADVVDVRQQNGRMKTASSLVHERIDDIPLLIGLAQKLRLPELLDRHLGNHGKHQGLSNGTLAAGWIAFILSRGTTPRSTLRSGLKVSIIL